MASLASESAFDVLAHAQKLERSGRQVAHLEIGEPDFPTPAHVVEAGLRALRDGETRYTPPAGIPELREAIAAACVTRGIAADPDSILVTPGAKTMLFYAILGVVEPGDEVLVPDPAYPMYRSAVMFAGGVPVSYPLRASARFRPDIDKLARRITPLTRAVILNAPQNPTGGGLSPAALERIIELAERHDLTVIADEVYGQISYGDAPAASIGGIAGASARTIIVDSFSKTYAMTGWRLGYGVLPPALVERFTTLAVNGHSCVPMFVQRAGIAALTGPQTSVQSMVAEYRRRRDWLVPQLAAIPGVTCALPAGAFYAFPNVERALEGLGVLAHDVADDLLENFGVAVVPGTAFGSGGEGHLRLSFAASQPTLERAVDGLRRCLETLREHPHVQT
jgi:aspartate/methionine/tyrosine aminotransferase